MSFRRAPAASSFRWVFVCLIACDIYYFALQSMSPLFLEIQSVFNVDNPTTGLLVSVVVIPGIILALPASSLVTKYGFRRIGGFALISVALGSLITALAINFPMLLLGRFIMGFGSCFLTIGTACIIPQVVTKKIGVAMGIYSIGSPLATIVAFSTVPLLAQVLGWRSPFYIAAFAGILFAALFFLFVKDVPMEQETNCTEKPQLRKSVKNSYAWKIGFMWLFFSVAQVGFVTWSPTLFVTYKGLDLVNSSALSSIYLISGLFFIPFYGYASDKLGSRKPIVIGGLLAMAGSMCALSLFEGAALAGGILIVGAAAGAIPALAFALMAQAMPLKHVGLGFGMMSFWNRTATLIAPPMVGYVLQATHSISAAFVFISCFALIGAGFAFSFAGNRRLPEKLSLPQTS